MPRGNVELDMQPGVYLRNKAVGGLGHQLGSNASDQQEPVPDRCKALRTACLTIGLIIEGILALVLLVDQEVPHFHQSAESRADLCRNRAEG
jgi:hypothetical protein